MTSKYSYRFPLILLVILAAAIPILEAWQTYRLNQWSTYLLSLVFGFATFFLLHSGVVAYVRHRGYTNSTERDVFMAQLSRENLVIHYPTEHETSAITSYPNYLFGLTRWYEGPHYLDHTRKVICRTKDGQMYFGEIRIYKSTYGPEFNCRFVDWMAKAPVPMPVVS